MNASVVDLTDHGCGGSGYVGIGYEGQPPVITIYYGVTSQHQDKASALALARKIIATGVVA